MADWAAFVGFSGVVLALLLLLSYLSRPTAERRDSSDRDSPSGERRESSGGRLEGSGTWSEGRTESRSGFRERRVGPERKGDGSSEQYGRAVELTDVPRDRRGPDDLARGADDPSDGADEPAGVADEPTGRTADPSGGADEPADGVPPALDVGADVRAGGLSGSAPSERAPSTAGLLVNVAISQGAFGALIVGGALITGVPSAAFGVTPETTGATALLAGAVLGVALYTANELGATVGERVGVGRTEELRAALAPDSATGWAILLVGVLPLIAGFEELLFRGTLVGAVAVGLGVSPWLMAVVSSVAFALGHGAQGPVGIAVSGALGFALAAAFVYTGSLLAVVVAHYLVNALEFVVHEGFGPG